MDTGRFFRHDETLIKRRPWYVLALALFVLSAFTHQPVVFFVAFFALIIGALPEIWYRNAFHHLVMYQHVSMRRVFLGETVTLSISVENQKVLPLSWLEVEDEIPASMTLVTGRAWSTYKVTRKALVNVFSLWSFQRVTRRYQLRCMSRGVYTFGPATVRTSDPFGWLIREENIFAHEALLVYPLIAPLESFGLPPRHPFGERATPRRLLEDPLRVAGVREYLVGDDPRRIHWKATARAGALRSKVYEPSSQYRLLILLDIMTYLEPWMGIDPEIQELAIAAAASLALWALDEGYVVGIIANSQMMRLSDEMTGETAPQSVGVARSFVHHVRIPLAADSGQRERILSALARLVPYVGSPMDELIAAERGVLPLGTTVVLVSAAAVLRESTIESLVDLRTHGAVVQLALTGDAETAVGTETYDIPVHHLGGREVWHELLETAKNDAGRSATSLHLD
jgi:uncharacterized protein (DUF58 family)